MKLLSLELENIRSYRKLEISFPSGSILFRGDMGSGKSTILMAIEFALFGSSNLIKNLVSKKEQKGEVKLCFDVNGTEYEIGRTVYVKNKQANQDSKKSYIMVDGVMEPLPVSDLKSKVLEILGFNESTSARANSRVYRYVVYVPQEEIKSIVENKDREGIIRQAFGMDDYATSTANIKEIIKNMKHANERTSIRFEKLNEYNADMQKQRTLSADLNNKLSKYKDNESKLITQKKTLQLKIDKIRSELDEIIGLNTEKKQLETTISDYKKNQASYKQNINVQKLKLSELDATIAQYADIKPPTIGPTPDIDYTLKVARSKATQYHAAVENSAKIQQKLKTIQNRLKDHNMDEISNIILNLESGITLNKSQIINIEKDNTTTNHDLGALRQQRATLTESLKHASALGSRCDVCESELDPASVLKLKTSRQSKLDDVNNDIITTENHINKSRSQISNITEQIQRDEKSLNVYKTMKQDAIEESCLQDELKEISADESLIAPDDYAVDGFPIESGETADEYLTRLSKALSDYDRKMDILAEKHQTKATLETSIDNTQRSYTDMTKKIESNQNRLDDVISKISQSDAVEKQDKLMREQKSEIETKINLVVQDISATIERLNTITNKIDELSSDIITAEKYKAKYDLYADNIEWLESYYIGSVMAIDKKTKISLRYDFDKFYQDWYSILVDDPTKSSIIDEQFGPILSQDGYDVPIDGLSGGEKTSVALAYRLALNSTMRRQTNILKSNLLILDEPTDGFSRHQMEKVRMIFESLHCEQIIMVSHETEMEGYVDHVFRVTKTEGISSVKRM